MKIRETPQPNYINFSLLQLQLCIPVHFFFIKDARFIFFLSKE